MESSKELQKKIYLWAFCIFLFTLYPTANFHLFQLFLPTTIFTLPKLQLSTTTNLYAIPQRWLLEEKIPTKKDLIASPHKFFFTKSSHESTSFSQVHAEVLQIALSITQNPDLREAKLNFIPQTLSLPHLGLAIQRVWLPSSESLTLFIDFNSLALHKETTLFLNIEKTLDLTENKTYEKNTNQYALAYLLLLRTTLEEHFSFPVTFLMDGKEMSNIL